MSVEYTPFVPQFETTVRGFGSYDVVTGLTTEYFLDPENFPTLETAQELAKLVGASSVAQHGNPRDAFRIAVIRGGRWIPWAPLWLVFRRLSQIRHLTDDGFEVAELEFEVPAEMVAKPFVSSPEPMGGDGRFRSLAMFQAQDVILRAYFAARDTVEHD